MFCKCGCGLITKIAKRNLKRRGIRKGESLNFIHGHNQKGKHHSDNTIKLMRNAQKNHPQYPGCGFQPGHEVSAETRQKISKANEGKSGPNKGKIMSNDERARISASLKSKGIRPCKIHKAYGKEHWNWKGGVTDEIFKLRKSDEYKIWRNSVYRRDKWTCQECGEKATRITAHHIKSFTHFPLLRFDVGNGVTLCRSCHALVHKSWDHSRVHHDKENPRTEITVRWAL